MNKPTKAIIQELLICNPADGTFRWKVSRGSVKAGNIAGGLDCFGYIVIRINNKLYRAHQLMWLYVYGVWPTKEIDHANQKKDDNRICNLREATRSQSNANKPKRNGKGLKGTWFDKRSGKWVASVCCDGVRYWLGSFNTALEGHQAYFKKAAELYGEFARAA